MLNPIWLNTFVTLIDTCHFTKAADKLFMTQPGVSQHINKLEQACGFALIRREKKSFEITEQGRMVYQYACDLAKNEKALIEQLAFDDLYAGNCTLACSGALVLHLYPKLLNLQVKHSGLVVKLKAAPNYQILAEIQQGIIDMGVVTDVPNKSFFDVKELGKEELCLVLPQNITIENNIAKLLTTLGMISHPDVEHYLSLYITNSHDKSLMKLVIAEIPIAGYINQISQILQPVAKGLGFTVLPKSAIESFPDTNLLQVYKPAKQVIETLYTVTKKNRVLPARYEAINAVLSSSMGR